jgi:predicted metalloenzyme YecM
MQLKEFYEGARAKIREFDLFARQYDLNEIMRADHIGYKCGSTREFEELRRLFESNSDFIYQSIISLRRIAIIKLAMPMHTCCEPISYLELSDQKPDHSQEAGFDHMEVYPMKGSAEFLACHLQSLGICVKKSGRPHHPTYDIGLYTCFALRIEEEPLVRKIIRDEMK